ncbi:MAG: transglycosylase SLT domain-containing protein [Pyrinomonadaceae bacterium]
MSDHTRLQRGLFLSLLIAGLCGALALPFCTASCTTQTQTKPGEQETIEHVRALTHSGQATPDQALAQIESQYAQTRAGALARLARARVKLAPGASLSTTDLAGALTLLDDKSFARATSIGDYALLLRAQALAQLSRRVEARAAYEQLARDYPNSLRAREASLRSAELALQDGQGAAVPTLLKKLIDADDADALWLAARAYEQQNDATRARAANRRIAFYAPVAPELTGSAAMLTPPMPITLPADILTNPTPTAVELTTRAERLAQAKRYNDAADAYKQLLAAFPNAGTTQTQLRYGIAAYNAGQQRTAEAVAALSAVPTSAGDMRAEALFYLAQGYARAKQWAQARSAADELRRAFPQDTRGVRALVAAGLSARDAKLTLEAGNFFRAAVAAAPGAVEVAQAQFELGWQAHEAKNYAESGRLLLEHLAAYADRNTDNRGRAGYWAGRDLERAGRTAEARIIYQAMQQRYDANWYGTLARHRLDVMPRAAADEQKNFGADAPVSRAVVNLSTVAVADETAGPEADLGLRKADELNVVGLDTYALEELNMVLANAPRSPRLNLAKARILRMHDDNLQAFLALQKSYPDYSQMKPEEMTREAWDVFYPLEHWDTITEEARAHNLDPYTVAGLIRQESVFDPRAKSGANAYGLMQLLLDTAQRTARKYNVTPPASVDALYEPALNIKLGTAYLRDQLDHFGRIEYVAAAYNAGPGRAERWLVELPHEIDEWAEAVPFKETRSYVQGVTRNTLQYKRLYTEAGRFRPEVGTRLISPTAPNANNPNAPPADTSVRPRRVPPDEQDEPEK